MRRHVNVLFFDGSAEIAQTLPAQLQILIVDNVLRVPCFVDEWKAYDEDRFRYYELNYVCLSLWQNKIYNVYKTVVTTLHNNPLNPNEDYDDKFNWQINSDLAEKDLVKNGWECVNDAKMFPLHFYYKLKNDINQYIEPIINKKPDILQFETSDKIQFRLDINILPAKSREQIKQYVSYNKFDLFVNWNYKEYCIYLFVILYNIIPIPWVKCHPNLLHKVNCLCDKLFIDTSEVQQILQSRLLTLIQPSVCDVGACLFDWRIIKLDENFSQTQELFVKGYKPYHLTENKHHNKLYFYKPKHGYKRHLTVHDDFTSLAKDYDLDTNPVNANRMNTADEYTNRCPDDDIPDDDIPDEDIPDDDIKIDSNINTQNIIDTVNIPDEDIKIDSNINTQNMEDIIDSDTVNTQDINMENTQDMNMIDID